MSTREGIATRRVGGAFRAIAAGRSVATLSRASLAVVIATLGLHAPFARASALDCASPSDAMATLSPCESTPGSATCCDALVAWDASGCFCDGVDSVIASSASYSAQVDRLVRPSACNITRSTTTSDPHCASPPSPPAALTPGLPDWAYAVHDGPSYAFKLVWSASVTPADPAPAAFVVTHCYPGYPPDAARCMSNARSEVVAAVPGMDAYDVSVPYNASEPLVAFVSLVSVDSAGVVSSARLGPFDEVVNYGTSGETLRTFVTPDANAASSAADCGAWWSPCGDIASALVAAAARHPSSTAPSTVALLPGVHASSGNCGRRLGAEHPVSIFGLPGMDPRHVVIDCTDAPSAGGFAIEPPEVIELSRVSVRNASRATGGGVFVNGTGADARLTDVILEACKADSVGGGAHVSGGAKVTFTRVVARECSGGNDGTGNQVRGGGVYVQGNDTEATLVDVTVAGCTLDERNSKGGGLNVDEGARVTVANLTARDNTAFFAAGVFVGSDCDVVVDGAVVVGNRATYAAGVGAFTGSKVELVRAHVAENVAEEFGGGLIAYANADVTLRRSDVRRNDAKTGAGVMAFANSRVAATDTAFVANTASESGAGIYLMEGSVARLTRSELIANVAPSGAGARVVPSAALIVEGGAVSRNNATAAEGGGILCEGGRVTLSNVSVVENTCNTLGGGLSLGAGCVADVRDGATFARNRAGRFVGERCHFEGAAGGGAVALRPNAERTDDATTLNATECAFVDNVAADGGAVLVTEAAVSAAGAAYARFGAGVVVSRNRAAGCPRAEAPMRSSASSASSVDSCSTPGGDGGGISAAAGVIRVADGASVSSNVALGSGGGISTSGVASLFVSGADTRVDDNVAARDGGGVHHAGLLLSITSGASVAGNAATDGGGVAVSLDPAFAASVAGPVAASFGVDRVFAVVGDVSLANNRAARRGGAAHVSAPLERGRFAGIDARRADAAAGAGIFWRRDASPDATFECVGCVFDDDDAVATEALGVDFDADLPEEMQSGVAAPTFAVSLVDHYGRVAATEDGATCALRADGNEDGDDARATEPRPATDALELVGALTNISVGGVVVFSDVTLRGRLGATYRASVTCERERDDAASGSSVAPLRFDATMATCPPGFEPLVSSVDASGAPVARECAACKYRTYNFDGVACKPCPQGGECPGGDRLDARSGWWRSTPAAEELFACPLRSSCLPGNRSAADACAPGYAGPVCGVCAEGYRRWGAACVPCTGTATYALPILGLVGFAAFVTYIFRAPAEDSADKACLFSCLVFVAQCLGLLKEYDIAFPAGIDRVVDAMDLSNFNLSALAPGCADEGVNFYRNFVSGVAVPPAVILVCWVVHARAEAARRQCYCAYPNRSRTDDDRYEELKRRCVRNAAWLLVLSYSGVTKTCLQLYNARALDVGYFLRRDYSISTDTDLYDTFATFGYFALLLYPVGIPVAIAWILRRGAREGALDDDAFRAKYGFLYAAYTPEFVAWELAGMCVKCVLAAIPVFATESNLRGARAGNATDETGATVARDYGAGGGFAAACQATMAQAACVAFILAALWFRPHRRPLHTAQQATAVAVVLGWVLVIGNVLNTERADDSAEAATATATATFSDDERFLVCFAAAVATAAAAVLMVVWSAMAGELDEIRNAPRRASDELRDMYRKLSVSVAASRAYYRERAKTKTDAATKKNTFESTNPEDVRAEALDRVDVRVADVEETPGRA